LKTGKYILGLMSGSSLDGLDIALIHFPDDFYQSKSWELIDGKTLPYSNHWINKLKAASDNADHDQIHKDFGIYLGQLVADYLKTSSTTPELIAVHGHTLYHQPEEGISIQLGAAQSIADVTDIPCMDDFRTQDTLLGGQGAPLAPTVEHWLFADHSVFLNIGGILNLSHHTPEKITAFDIGPGNQLLNALAKEVDQDYDNNGQLAQQGTVVQPLLKKAQSNNFYQQLYPKSLSNQWVQDEVIPLFKTSKYSLEDRMATAVSLIAWTLQLSLQQIGLTQSKILLSGGGVYNNALLDCMKDILKSSNHSLLIPSDEIINYKEAALMSLMGFLNITGSNNVFGDSTGSKINHCAGNLCVPNSFLLV